MAYEFLRLIIVILFHFPRFFGTAFGIFRLIQQVQMRRLQDQADVMGFSKRKFGKKWDSADLKGEFSGIEIQVQSQFGGSSRTGTFVTAQLTGNPRRLLLQNGLYNYLISLSYKGSYYPRFDTGHRGFDTTFLSRFADAQTAKTLTESKDLLDEITRFYRTWVLSTHSFSIDNTEGKTRMIIRLTYGCHFHPYIRPEILRELVDGMVRIGTLWKKVFGSRLTVEEKKLAGMLLTFAGNGNATKVAELLAHNASVSYANKNHETALHLGAGSRNIEVVRLLLDAGADPNALDQGGRTPLFRIIACPTDPALLELLLNRGTDVNVIDLMGETALFQPARWDDVPTVKTLIEHGIDVTPVNQCQETAWSVAKPGTGSRKLIEEAGGGL